MTPVFAYRVMRRQGDRLLSTSAPGRFCRVYRQWYATVPALGTDWLFGYESVSEACALAETVGTSLEVWECQGELAETPEFICGGVLTGHYEDFWATDTDYRSFLGFRLKDHEEFTAAWRFYSWLRPLKRIT